jgi:hypothetical protein
MGGFTVDPDTFAPTADQLRQAGAQLTSAWDPVMQQSQSVRFGTDDVVSPLIQVSIQGAVALVDSCVKSSVEALNGYADGLENMGKTYAEAETGTTTMMTAE